MSVHDIVAACDGLAGRARFVRIEPLTAADREKLGIRVAAGVGISQKRTGRRRYVVPASALAIAAAVAKLPKSKSDLKWGQLSAVSKEMGVPMPAVRRSYLQALHGTKPEGLR